MCPLKRVGGKTKRAEVLGEKKVEEGMLISEVHILSPVSFNGPFNYQTLHLYKHPHPLQPEPETRTHSPAEQGRKKKRTVGGPMFVKHPT